MIMYDLCHRYRRSVLRDEAAILIALIPVHNSILEMTMSRQEEPTSYREIQICFTPIKSRSIAISLCLQNAQQNIF